MHLSVLCYNKAETKALITGGAVMSNTKKILKKKVNDSSSPAIENTFSFRLAFALASRMMSQAELAKACDIAPSNISQYLAKNAEPRIDKLKLNEPDLMRWRRTSRNCSNITSPSPPAGKISC